MFRRCDLGIALFNGSVPMFFRQPSEPVIEYPQQLLPGADDKIWSQDNTELLRHLDSYLATVWRVMRRFCSLANLGAQTRRLFHPEFIHQTMIAVVYRLLHVGFADGSIDETVRLGLLAYCHHIFLQWQDVRLPYRHFADAYQNCILRLKLVDGASPRLVLWLLMTGANSVFNVSDEAWLRECWQEHAGACHASRWKQVQGILESFMCISFLDEEPGKRNYDLLRREKRSGVSQSPLRSHSDGQPYTQVAEKDDWRI
jgi:hypothetical protein